MKAFIYYKIQDVEVLLEEHVLPVELAVLY